MAYRSILTVLTDTATLPRQLDAAISLARREDAHLEALCLGIDRTQPGYYYAGATAVVQQATLDRAREDADVVAAAARTRLESEDIRWGVDSGYAQLGAIGGLVALEARFSDLVVLAKPYGGQVAQDGEVVTEAALFDGRAPVLTVPDTGLPDAFGRRIVLAWNQSDEALMACRAALPFLKAATSVNIAVIDPPAHGPERSDPGGRLSQFLSRHGVRAEVSVLARTLPRVSEVLIRHVRDTNSDMVVMGAYGHSRFREAILGGVTREMLELAETPVLMAH